MLLLGSLGLGAGVALIAFTVLSQAQEKAVVRSTLRQLDEYEVENVRDQELLVPLKDRAIAPVVGRLNQLARRFTPVGYVDNARTKVVLAGNANANESLDRFLAVRVLTVAAIPVVLIYVFGFSPLTGKIAVAVAGMFSLLLALGPDAILNRKIQDRQHQIRTRLPDVLDLLVISVEAGLGFDQALDRTISAVPGPLTDEFGRMLGETRAGARRADALRALDERTDVPEIRSFVLALLQADTFGVSISRVLRTQADEMRIKRRQLAQEQAQKAPVKMLVPMVFCVFPALFVVVLGPAIINIYQNFK